VIVLSALAYGLGIYRFDNPSVNKSLDNLTTVHESNKEVESNAINKSIEKEQALKDDNFN